MYIIQMFDDRNLSWDNVSGGDEWYIDSMEEADDALAWHKESWPNCIFRIMLAA